MSTVLISGYVYIGLLLCIALLALMMIIITTIFFDLKNKYDETTRAILMLDRNGKERANLLKAIESLTFSSIKQGQELGASLADIKRNILKGNKDQQEIKTRLTWSKT